MLEKLPGARFTSALELRRELGGLVVKWNLPVSVPPDSASSSATPASDTHSIAPVPTFKRELEPPAYSTPLDAAAADLLASLPVSAKRTKRPLLAPTIVVAVISATLAFAMWALLSASNEEASSHIAGEKSPESSPAVAQTPVVAPPALASPPTATPAPEIGRAEATDASMPADAAIPDSGQRPKPPPKSVVAVQERAARVTISGMTPTGQTPLIEVRLGDTKLGSGARVVITLAPGDYTLKILRVGGTKVTPKVVTFVSGQDSEVVVLLD
jgi:hypothetical protein